MIAYFKHMFYEILYFFWEISQFKKLKSYPHDGDVLVVDIDNTITVTTKESGINHVSPIPRLPMIEYINELKKQKDLIIFLSARDFRIFDETFKFLSSHSLLSKREVHQLILVKSARHKLAFLSYLESTQKNVEYIDDLSYNHENGEIKFYDEVINKIKLMKISYRDYNFINQY
jgi:hydroxymethylpyrimidine pyrophosphatase-like HAD family hydrolase